MLAIILHMDYVAFEEQNGDRQSDDFGKEEHEQFYFDLIEAYMRDMTEEEKKDTVHTLSHIQNLLTNQLENRESFRQGSRD